MALGGWSGSESEGELMMPANAEVPEQPGEPPKAPPSIRLEHNFMWIFAINGLLWMLYTLFSGEWHFLLSQKQSLREAFQVTLVDLHLRKGLPSHTKYNGAQRIAYTACVWMGAGMLLTGCAIYKPTEAHWLTSLLGGYEMAFLSFFVVHVTQVVLAGWNNFRAMVSGLEVQRAEAPSLEDERRGWRWVLMIAIEMTSQGNYKVNTVLKAPPPSR
jgi:hypothetical protein